MNDGQQLGLQLKEKALDRFEGRPWMERARAAARNLLTLQESVTIDDVRKVVGPPSSPNMAGSVFRAGFKPVGRVLSNKAHGHGNVIRQWVLDHPADYPRCDGCGHTIAVHLDEGRGRCWGVPSCWCLRAKS